jgi:extracellular factor (EF) 3-hydroxypalmitic acid methyl ester biosynthesis protein
MYQDAMEIKASLVDGNRTIPIDAKYTSKYSLLIRFLNGNSFNDRAEFSKLVIRMNGDTFELGRCRVLSEPNIDGYAGRLVFINDIYDLENLLFHNKLLKLQNAFLNLPLIVAHKHEIIQSFKNYTANLTYDLNVYKNLFDNLDSEYAEEPEDIRESLQEAIINTEGRKFMKFLDDRLLDLEGIVGNFSKEEHARHGFYFRKQLWNIILCAPFMARTNLKPRGYAGDSEMMTMLYSNDYRGDSTFSKLMHKHPVEQPAAQAVRNRRVVIAKMVRDLIETWQRPPGEQLRVLSVACGPVREIKDILLSPDDCKQMRFTLLDQDRDALYEAAKMINKTEKHFDTKISADYLNESVRTMLATPRLKSEWGQFNIIYSMGLFDYLTPPVASAVLGKLYQLLKPGGEMVIGNFHVSNPSKYYMEYWLDWVLYYRTEGDLKNLLKNAPSAKSDAFIDDTGVQMFLHVKKVGDDL